MNLGWIPNREVVFRVRAVLDVRAKLCLGTEALRRIRVLLLLLLVLLLLLLLLLCVVWPRCPGWSRLVSRLLSPLCPGLRAPNSYPYPRGLAGPEIVDFGGLHGPFQPKNPLGMVGGEAPHLFQWVLL